MTSTSLLAPGSPAPTDTIADQDGNAVSLKDFIGKKIVLFFYPKANTPTCTVEACNLRDHNQELKDKGFVLLGISPDSERKQKNFHTKFDLTYPLLADHEMKLTKGFGVWAEKKTFGKTYMGVLRTTFVIDEKGIISHVVEKVKSKDHASQILEMVGN